MAGAEGAVESRPLEYTPTWAVAVVCTIYVVVSLFAERGLHRLGSWLTKTKRKPLYEALEKIREELMLLGFISLLLTVTADYVSRICVKTSFYEKQPSPCKKPSKTADHGRTLFESLWIASLRRSLAVTPGRICPQVHGWRHWEQEAHSSARDTLAVDITKRITLQRNSTFVLYHTSRPWSRNRFFVWLVCFFRQFGQGVRRVDYLALRMGFIKNHHTSENYDFHSYMIRSMEDEFKKIVGISPSLWTFVVAFMLFNVEGWNLYFWLASLPIILILVVGAKLQHIIATLALEHAGIHGRYEFQQLRPRDELFWFKRPELMFKLIHFILFQNAFELATFFWSWWQFGRNSCLLRNHYLVFARLTSGLAVQFLCSYSTLPLYALVTQMGSKFKRAIFNESIMESLHGWRKKARRKPKSQVVHESSPAEDADGYDELEVELEDVRDSAEDEYKQQSMPILRTENLSLSNVLAGHKFSSMDK